MSYVRRMSEIRAEIEAASKRHVTIPMNEYLHLERCQRELMRREKAEQVSRETSDSPSADTATMAPRFRLRVEAQPMLDAIREIGSLEPLPKFIVDRLVELFRDPAAALRVEQRAAVGTDVLTTIHPSERFLELLATCRAFIRQGDVAKE